MIDPKEKSTGLSLATESAQAGIGDGLVLDGRLALHHREQSWLAVADLHFGYEANRRREGALWPMWGMESIEERLRGLVRDYRPATLILVGDVVDGFAAPEAALAWLASLRELCPELVLVEGNHDRGLIRKAFDWVPFFETGGFRFEHGHLDAPSSSGAGTRVRGHLHPSVRIHDGAGTVLKLPSLVLEEREGGRREIILPAFSPWAGGGRHAPRGANRVREWACSPRRVFEVSG